MDIRTITKFNPNALKFCSIIVNWII